MRRFLAVCLLICVMLSLCGCDIYSESESRYIVSFIGFDGGNKVTVSVEAVSGSGSTGQESTSFIFTASGDTPAQAVYNLSASLTKPLLFDHCAVVAAGNSLSDTQLEGVLGFCREEKALNLAVYIVSAENAAELISGDKTVAAASGYDIMGIIEHCAEYSGVIFGNRFYEIEAKNTRKYPFFSLPLLKKGESGVYVAGERFYRENKCVLTVSLQESRIYSLLCNSSSGGSIGINGNIAKIKSSHTDFGINKDNTPLNIDLKIKLSGQADALFCKELISGSEALIAKAKASGAGDIFGFADNIFRRDITLWQDISGSYNEFFKNCNISISIDKGGSIGA